MRLHHRHRLPEPTRIYSIPLTSLVIIIIIITQFLTRHMSVKV